MIRNDAIGRKLQFLLQISHFFGFEMLRGPSKYMKHTSMVPPEKEIRQERKDKRERTREKGQER